MKCVQCNNKSKVINSREWLSHITRRRECLKCYYRFTTTERYDNDNLNYLMDLKNGN